VIKQNYNTVTHTTHMSLYTEYVNRSTVKKVDASTQRRNNRLLYPIMGTWTLTQTQKKTILLFTYLILSIAFLHGAI